MLQEGVPRERYLEPGQAGRDDPAFEQKKNRILELYAIADGLTKPGPHDPAVVICLDEFGPLNLQPQPGGKAWAPRAKPRRIRATLTRPHGVRHLLCARKLRHLTRRELARKAALANTANVA